MADSKLHIEPMTREEAEALLAEGISGGPQELETARDKLYRALSSQPEQGGRTLSEIGDWIKEREGRERRMAPADPNTAAGGMAMGALETLDALTRYLNGDDDA